MEKRILIFYGSYGAGHFSVARSIKEYIENHYENIEIKMVDCIEYINKYYNKLSIKTYENITKKHPIAWKGVYYGSETWPIRKITSTANRFFSHKLNKLIKEFKPDLIISTHFFSSEMCAILKKHRKLNCKIATVMTDYESHKQWLVHNELIDYYFIANNAMQKELEKFGVDSSKIHVTGIPLSDKFLQEYNTDDIINEFNLQKNITTILYFAGGSSHVTASKSSNIFKSLLNVPNIQLITITGKSAKLKDDFEEILKNSNTKSLVKILGFTNKVPELMQISDLVITKPGGLTVTESLASSLPILVLDPIPGQEEGNAKYLESNGAAIWIKKQSEIENILNTILENPSKLKEMKKSAEKLAKKNSTKDICNVLL